MSADGIGNAISASPSFTNATKSYSSYSGSESMEAPPSTPMATFVSFFDGWPSSSRTLGLGRGVQTCFQYTLDLPASAVLLISKAKNSGLTATNVRRFTYIPPGAAGVANEYAHSFLYTLSPYVAGLKSLHESATMPASLSAAIVACGRICVVLGARADLHFFIFF